MMTAATVAAGAGLNATLTGRHVLVLNASYEPLHRVSVKHAIRMLVRQVAVIEEADDSRMVGPFKLPMVLRLIRYVAMSWKYTPRGEAQCSKAAIKARDKMCGYCGGSPETVDHIIPLSRGGHVTWLNAVAACERCNHAKGSRTPAEAGMELLLTPYVPTKAELRSA